MPHYGRRQGTGETPISSTIAAPVAFDARSRRASEIRALTGIRGVAALYVVAYHIDMGQADVGPAQHILHHGYLAVDLFFVLSGFVMALTAADMRERGVTLARFGGFFGKRIARVYPLYLFSTLLYLVVDGFAIGPNFPSLEYWTKLGANLLLAQSWGVSGSINGVAWSISTEWLAYLLFPALLWLTFRCGPWRCVIVALVCAALLCALVAAPDFLLWCDAQLRQGPLDRADPQSLAPILRCVAEFTAGLLTFRLAASGAANRFMRAPAAGIGVGVLAIALLAAPNGDLAFALLTPALLLSLAADTGPAARLLGSRVMHRLGVLSYAVYLLHPFILWPGLAWMTAGLRAHHVPLAAPVSAATALALTLAAAAAGHVMIERPARRLLRAVL